jgi:uncharacterized phage-associated protein
MRKNIKQLNLNPLSVAKYFYEKLGERGVEQTFLQPITYLAYQEILKKENVLLFKEEFQNGLASPVLSSLKDLIRNHGNRLDKFFSSVPNLNNQLVLSYLEKLTKKFSKSFDCEIQYQAQNNYEKQTPALV